MDDKKLKIEWPNGHDFAFTVFDDTDNATLHNVRPVYKFLLDLGLIMTKSVWPIKSKLEKPLIGGDTCEEKDYLEWLLYLKDCGVEIALHNVTNSSSTRQDIKRGFDRFKEYFGCNPNAHANHADCEDGIYWGDSRLTGLYRFLYSVIKHKNYNKYRGHVKSSKFFWGDICKSKIQYVRNFTFNDINTLKMCPFMPYHDSTKPFVNYFFCSSNGSEINTFNKLLSEKNQDRLEHENGACIVYTHFGYGFYNNGKLNPRFLELIERLVKKMFGFVQLPNF